MMKIYVQNARMKKMICFDCVYCDKDIINRCELTGEELEDFCNKFEPVNRRYSRADYSTDESTGLASTEDV